MLIFATNNTTYTNIHTPKNIHPHPHPYKGFAPFGSLTLNTKTCVSRLNPDASAYLFLPELIYPKNIESVSISRYD